MAKSLERALAEMVNLPEADQEQIGQQLLSHFDKLRRLRGELDRGIRSMDQRKGEPLDVDAFLLLKNERQTARNI